MRFDRPFSAILDRLPCRLGRATRGAAFLIAASALAAGSAVAQGLDQANAPASWTGGASNIVPGSHAEQTFTPTYGCLTKVEVGLMTGNRGRGNDKVTLKILDWSDLSQPKELASVSASVPEGFDGFWPFTLAGTGVKVPTGIPWVVILLQDSGKNVFWWKYQNGNPYPGGNRFFGGKGDDRYDYLFKTYGAASCQAAQSFSLTVTPDPVNLAPGGSQPVTIGVVRQGGFADPVKVALSLPSTVTATPTGPLTIAGASGTTTLKASGTAAAGSFSATATGSAAGFQAVPKSFKINITAPAAPSITAVTPASQQRGGTITVAGSGFDPSCGSNKVSFAALDVVPTACAAGSLIATVPPQAAYGPTQLTVSASGRKSNALAFSVGRQPGDFAEISGDILHQHASRNCTAGTVKLNVTAARGGGSYTASFRRVAGGTAIGSSITFYPDYSYFDSSGVKYTRGNLGGAGFSSCSVGIVLNANNTSTPLLILRDLDSASDFRASPYTANIRVPGLAPPYSEDYDPRIFRSPDGTIILAVTAASWGSAANLTATFFDKAASGQILKTVSLTDPGSHGVGGHKISATVTSANEIVLTFGSQTLAPISIP